MNVWSGALPGAKTKAFRMIFFIPRKLDLNLWFEYVISILLEQIRRNSCNTVENHFLESFFFVRNCKTTYKLQFVKYRWQKQNMFLFTKKKRKEQKSNQLICSNVLRTKNHIVTKICWVFFFDIKPHILYNTFSYVTAL